MPLFTCKLKYLGLVISKEGIETDNSKVEAITEMKPPKNSKEVSKFLGMAGWYQKFIPKYADICEPLYRLKKKGPKFNWSTEAQDSFDKIKRALTEAPVLQSPNFTEQFNLFTDASGIGIGAVLNQKHRPIAFGSRTLNKAERNYTVTERESLRALALNSREQLILEQRENPELGHIYSYLENPDDGSVNATVCEVWSQDFKLINGLLFYAKKKYSTTLGELRVYIPRSLREKIMKEFHVLPLAGHLGNRKTYLKLRDTCNFPYMRKYIFEYVSTCDRCQKFNYKNALPAGRLIPIVSNYPNEIVTLDLLSLYPESRPERYRFLLVITDHFTKWSELIPSRKASALAIANTFFENYISRYGAPISLIRDNGPQFISEVFEHLIHSPDDSLFCKRNHENWDPFLNEFAFALRTSVNETTNKTPAELFLGRKIITPFSKLINVTEGAEYVGRNIEKLFDEARQNMRKQHKNWEKYYNRKRREVSIKVNDLVLVQTHFISAAGRRVFGKIMPKFQRPYRVLEVRNNNLIIWKKGKRVTVNIDQLRVYRPRQSDTISSDSHLGTLYEGQRSSNRSSRSQPGKFKGSRKNSRFRAGQATYKRSRHEGSGQYNKARETKTTKNGTNRAAERRPVRSKQATAVRPCPYYLRSRVRQPEGFPEEQKNIGMEKKLTVWCALWAVGIIGPYFFKTDEGHNVTVNGDRYRAMITIFFIPELNNHDVHELWFQQDGATCHTARATIDLLKDTFGDRLISRFGPVNWPPRSCNLTPLDYFLWGYVKSLVCADKPQTLDHLEDNIRRVIADIRPQMLEKVIENWTSRLDYIRASRGSPMPEIIFKIQVVKVSDRGLPCHEFDPSTTKTRRVGERYTLNLSRAETSSLWCGVVVRRGGASSGAVPVTLPWFKLTWSVAKSHRVAEQCDWVTSHMGIDGNEKADFFTKTAAEEGVSPTGSSKFSSLKNIELNQLGKTPPLLVILDTSEEIQEGHSSLYLGKTRLPPRAITYFRHCAPVSRHSNKAEERECIRYNHKLTNESETDLVSYAVARHGVNTRTQSRGNEGCAMMP
ncbi:retrovirus-related Pol polyprotein from transposon 17.6 [Trichonephila clavipes]|nr:retrovirus-related Pol polyprotein from transposon 17.6 [Trichonephila clavipes]